MVEWRVGGAILCLVVGFVVGVVLNQTRSNPTKDANETPKPLKRRNAQRKKQRKVEESKNFFLFHILSSIFLKKEKCF